MATHQHRRIALVLLLAGAAVAIGASDLVHGVVYDLLEVSARLIHRHQLLGLIVFAALSAVSALAFFFSTAVIVPVAVHAWGEPATITLLWGSWLVGGAASYWIGRRPGRRIARWLVPERRVAEYERQLARRAGFGVVLLFQLAVPSEIPGYVLGALRYPFGAFMATRAIAELPFAVGAVYLGSTFIERRYSALLAIALAGVMLSAVALIMLRRRLSN